MLRKLTSRWKGPEQAFVWVGNKPISPHSSAKAFKLCPAATIAVPALGLPPALLVQVVPDLQPLPSPFRLIPSHEHFPALEAASWADLCQTCGLSANV